MNSFCGQLTVLARSMQPNVFYVFVYCILFIVYCLLRMCRGEHIYGIFSGLYSTLYSDISGAKCEH